MKKFHNPKFASFTVRWSNPISEHRSRDSVQSFADYNEALAALNSDFPSGISEARLDRGATMLATRQRGKTVRYHG